MSQQPSTKPNRRSILRQVCRSRRWIFALIFALILTPFQSVTQACCCSDQSVAGQFVPSSSLQGCCRCCQPVVLARADVGTEGCIGLCCSDTDQCQCCDGLCKCGSIEFELSHHLLIHVGPVPAGLSVTGWVSDLPRPNLAPLATVAEPSADFSSARRHCLLCVWLI